VISNPLNRVMFRNKALDYFRFAIGPQNIDTPARAKGASLKATEQPIDTSTAAGKA
jgi:hypothetical protein